MLQNKKNLFTNLLIIFLFLITFSFANSARADWCDTAVCDQTATQCIYNGFPCNGICVLTDPVFCDNNQEPCDYIVEYCEPLIEETINGACSSTHYGCGSGGSINNNDGESAWTWQCAGSGGGSDASCSEGKTQCSDGADNDGDGSVDMGDYFCTDLGDDDERGPAGGWSACSCGGTRTCTNPTPESGGADCVGSTSCTPTGGCGGPVNGSCSATHYNCDAGTSGSNVDGATEWTWMCNGSGGGTNASCSEPKTMSGTLTPPTASCNIAAGASSCNVNFSWTTTNPVATSSVTSDTNNTGAPSAGFVVASGNNGGPVPFAIPYLNNGVHAGRNFYLYNNGIKLDESLASGVTSECVAGTVWNGTTCVPSTTMFGVISGANCTIALGSSSCTTTLSWTVTNPENVLGSNVTSNTNNSGVASPGFVIAPPVTTGNVDVGTKTLVTIPYSSRTFFLNNNAKSLYPTSPSGSGLVVSASCTSGTSWDGDSCENIPSGTFNIDLQVNGGQYNTAETALSVTPEEVLSFSWTATGNTSLNCSATNGTAGWAGSVADNNPDRDFTAPDTVGIYEYSLQCQNDSDLGMSGFDKFLAFFNPFNSASAVNWQTLTDSVWVSVSNIACVSPEDCLCTVSECECESGCSITYSWECLPPATASIGIGFSTDLNGDGIGDMSGTVTLNPSTDTEYGHICNGGPQCLDEDDCSTPVDVIKKPFYIED